MKRHTFFVCGISYYVYGYKKFINKQVVLITYEKNTVFVFGLTMTIAQLSGRKKKKKMRPLSAF